MNTTKFAMKLAIPLFVALAYGPAQGLAAPVLGADLSTFAVLGATTVTNVPTATIVGNVGVWQTAGANAITGFLSSPGLPFLDPQVTGSVHAGTILGTPNAMAAQGQLDTAYDFLAPQFPPPGGNLTGSVLGTDVLSLNPGIYRFNSSAQLTGTLTLDAQNDPNALFIFNIGTALTTASYSVVNVINAVPGAGVFWLMGVYGGSGTGSATLGSYSTFEGNLLALTSITLDPYAKITCGRALADQGAVTLSGYNAVSIGCMGTGEAGTGGLGGVITNVPEPETYAMLLAGLGMMGFVARRRQRNLAAAA